MTTTQDPDRDERLNLPSASKFDRVVNCPGSIPLERQIASLPEAAEPPSPEAERGTKIHRAIETEDPSLLEDDTETEAYKRGIQLRDAVTNQWLSDYGVTEHAIVDEVRLWLNDQTTLKPIMSGRFDRTLISDKPSCALVIDYKTGQFGGGNVSENWQLRLGAIMCKYEYGVKRVRVALVEPEVGKEGRTDYADYDEDTLSRWEYAVHYHLWFAEQPNAPRRAGSHCRYCPCRGAFCPESAVMALLPSAQAQDGLLAKIDTLTPEDLAVIHTKKRIVNAVFDRVKDRLAAMTDNELGALGLKRTLGKKTDRVTNVHDAIGALQQAGLEDQELCKALSLSIPELVTLVRAFKNITVKDAKLWVDLILNEYITRGRGEPSIVPA